MVLSQLPQSSSPRGSPSEEHRQRLAAIVRAVLQQRRFTALQAVRHHSPGQIVEQMRIIDIHTHFFPQSWPDLSARFGTPDWPWIKHTEPGKAVIMLGNREFRKIYSACWDPEVRLQEMQRDGLDLQIISATPVLFSY